MAIQIAGSTIIDNSRNIVNAGIVTATSFSGSGANITDLATFPTGTVMLFQQTAAPTGWTKKIDAGFDNKALRVVTGTATTTGGTSNFTTVFASRTPTGSVSSSSGPITATGSVSTNNGPVTATGSIVSSSGPTSITIAQLAAHTHTVAGTVGAGGGLASGANFTGNAPGIITGPTGSGTAHNHPVTSTFTGTAHDHPVTSTFTGTAHNHPVTSTFTGNSLDFAVQYIDVIFASKN